MNDKLLINLSDISIAPPVIDRRGNGGIYNYIKWGSDNCFSNTVLDLIHSSPLQSSVMKNMYNKMIGANIIVPTGSKPNLFDSWQDIVRKCMKDYSIFEAFSIQCVMNMDGRTFSFYHQPVSEVRLGKSTYGQNDIDNAYICSDWVNFRTAKVREIKMFGADQKPEPGVRYLLYFSDYEPGEYYYHTPNWFSAANWIAADARLSKYYNNFVANNFNSNKVITYPCEVDEEEKNRIYSELKENFSGERSGGSFILMFGEGEMKPTIDNLSSPDADLYNSLVTVVRDNIITANRLTSPILAGISTGSNMSSQAEQLIAAHTQYNITVINPARSYVLGRINALLSMNGETDVITIEDYDIRAEFEGNTLKNDIIEDESVSTDTNL